MEALVDEGKVRSIGVSNFNTEQLEKLLKSARIRPAVNQIEIHPWLTQPDLHQFCKSHDILLMAYSPFGGQHPVQQNKYAAQTPLQDDTIVRIARETNKEPAQIIISWLVQRGNIVIAKSSRESRIQSNFHLSELSQTDFDDIEKITSSNGQVRFGNWDTDWGTHLFTDEVL